MNTGETRVLLAQAAAAYGRTLSDEIVNVWAEFFGDVLLAEAMEAMRGHIEEMTFFPTVAAIKGRINEARKQAIRFAYEDERKAKP